MESVTVYTKIGNYRYVIPVIYKSIPLSIAHFELITGKRIAYYLDKNQSPVII